MKNDSIDGNAKSDFKKITIIGVGLIGGSLALAIRQHFPNVQITGVDKQKVLKRALERHAINTPELSVSKAVRNADLVIIATSISSIVKLLPKIAESVNPDAIVTDTGSVKKKIVAMAQKFFRNGNFIGGHPMAGSESKGIEAAHPLLFQNSIYILTPDSKTKRANLKKLANFLRSIEAHVITIDPSVHDSVVSAISHLPQLAAVALMNTVGKKHPHARFYLTLAGGGFRDMTRIASSPFDIWQEILGTNQNEVKKSLDLYINELQKIEKTLGKNPARLSREFQSSRNLRAKIPRSIKGFFSPLFEITVYLEDKPGSLARMTNILAQNSINIKDLELLKVREGHGGTFKLCFENRTIADEAANLLKKEGFDVTAC